MKHSQRRGFTLIELMVVIGIILVLVAIVVLGLRHVNYTAARHETIAEMKICSDMLTEYKNVHGSLGEMTTVAGVQQTSGIEMTEGGTPYPLTLPAPWQTVSVNLPVYLDSASNPPVEITGGKQQSVLLTDDFAGKQNGNGTVSLSSRDMGDKLESATARYYCNAVQWTQAVNYLLLREPKLRSMVVSNVPSKRILEVPANVTPPSGGAYDALASAVILDGWGDPIVYVPRGGMHVLLKASGTIGEFVVRSSGIYSTAILPPVGPNDHPFFASAGQDGVFTDSLTNATAGGVDYAIDNIYSFQE